MTCEQRRDLILLDAAGGLEPAEQQELRAHLRSGCPVCAGYVAESQMTLAHLPLVLDPVAPPAGVRLKLMKRVEAQQRSQSEDPASLRISSSRQASSVPIRPSRLYWISSLAAAAGLILGASVMAFLFRADRATLDRQQSRVDRLERTLEDRERTIGTLQKLIDDTGNTIRLVRSPALVVNTLKGTKDDPDAWGRVLRDQASGEWVFVVGNLKPLPADRTYELWIIPQGKDPVAAGVFDVGTDGRGVLPLKLPAGLGPLAAVAVTAEPRGGSSKPTMPIRMMGTLE